MKDLLKSSILQKEIDILEVEQRIRGRIQTQVEKNQREYYLTEQIKAIHKELGRGRSTGQFEQLRAKLRHSNQQPEAAEK